MTIRIRPITLFLNDDRELAAQLTPCLLGSLRDDAPDGTAHAKPGTAWLRWSSAKPTNPGLD